MLLYMVLYLSSRRFTASSYARPQSPGSIHRQYTGDTPKTEGRAGRTVPYEGVHEVLRSPRHRLLNIHFSCLHCSGEGRGVLLSSLFFSVMFLRPFCSACVSAATAVTVVSVVAAAPPDTFMSRWNRCWRGR